MRAGWVLGIIRSNVKGRVSRATVGRRRLRAGHVRVYRVAFLVVIGGINRSVLGRSIGSQHTIASQVYFTSRSHLSRYKVCSTWSESPVSVGLSFNSG